MMGKIVARQISILLQPASNQKHIMYLTTTTKALTQLGLYEGLDVLLPLSAKSLDSNNKFCNPHRILSLLFTAAKANMTEPQFREPCLTILQFCYDHFEKLRPEDAGRLLWAISSLGLLDHPLAENVAKMCYGKINESGIVAQSAQRIYDAHINWTKDGRSSLLSQERILEAKSFAFAERSVGYFEDLVIDIMENELDFSCKKDEEIDGIRVGLGYEGPAGHISILTPAEHSYHSDHPRRMKGDLAFRVKILKQVGEVVVLHPADIRDKDRASLATMIYQNLYMVRLSPERTLEGEGMKIDFDKDSPLYFR